MILHNNVLKDAQVTVSENAAETMHTWGRSCLSQHISKQSIELSPVHEMCQSGRDGMQHEEEK